MKKKKQWNSKFGFCEFPVTLLHICTDYNIYALCHSAISQFRRAISTLSSSFLDTIWYTFTLDLEKKNYYLEKRKITIWVTERNSRNNSWYIKVIQNDSSFHEEKSFLSLNIIMRRFYAIWHIISIKNIISIYIDL